VRRPLLALLLTLPAVIGGSLTAHFVTYLVANPDGHERARVLAETGHAYLQRPWLIALVLMTVFGVGGLLCVHSEIHGRASGRVSVTPFLLGAPLGYAALEHLERLFATGTWPADLLVQPSFLFGLALQLPFAVLAVAISRLVLRSASSVARAVRRRAVMPRWTTAPRVVRAAVTIFTPRPAALAGAGASRAPPARFAS
jgi:hypothetical protein